jgi:hypothetical protein
VLKGGRPCEPDPAPPALAAAVFTAATGGQDVRPALRRWEGEIVLLRMLGTVWLTRVAALPRDASAHPVAVRARPSGLILFASFAGECLPYSETRVAETARI